MSRARGTFTLSANYDLSIDKPFDARTLVPTYEDLVDETNWKAGARIIAFNGMIVSVANTQDTKNNGLYMLFDKDAGGFKQPDVTDYSHWIKIGENKDLPEILNRLTTIESTLSDITDRLNVIENKKHVITYAEYEQFPTTGEENVLYVAVDKNATYIYVDANYVCVGSADSATIDIEVIHGGTAVHI